MNQPELAPIPTSRHPRRTVSMDILKELTANIFTVYADGESIRAVKKAMKKHAEVADKDNFKKQVLASAKHALEIKLGDFRHSLYPRILRMAGAKEVTGLAEAVGLEVDTNLLFELDGIRYVIDCKKQDNRGADARKELVINLLAKKDSTKADFAYLWFCAPTNVQKGREFYSNAFEDVPGVYACFGSDLFRLLNISIENNQNIADFVEKFIADAKLKEQLEAAFTSLNV